MKVKSHQTKLFGIIAVSSLILTACATSDMNAMMGQGSAVSNSSTPHHAISTNRVKIYYGNAGLPKHYRVIGRISAENYNMLGMEHSQSDIAAELKKQAASIGANGVINIASGLGQTTGDAILSK